MKAQTILDNIIHPITLEEGFYNKVIQAMKMYADLEIEKFTDWTISHECEFGITNNNEWTNQLSNVKVTTKELYDIYKANFN